MRIFLSYAEKDAVLAGKLAALLTDDGHKVWVSDEEIAFGDNWAKKMGKALDESECMVILLTSGAMKSDLLRQHIDFALGAKKFAHRVFTVFVGAVSEAGKDIPWILLKLPTCFIGSPRDFDVAVAGIQALSEKANLSHSNA